MQERLSKIRSGLQGFAGASYPPQLLAVSKGQPASQIKALYDLGHRHFGENYAQEMIEKMELLADACPDICWHFIGKIQKRQAKSILRAQWIHSVGSEKEMSYLSKHASADGGWKILLQVNIAREPQKGGFLPESLEHFETPPLNGDGFHLSGLMCLPPFGHSETKGAHFFSETRLLRDKLAEKWECRLPELSMGMSADYELAMSEGATWVRIGTFLFGPRPQKPKTE